MMWKLLFAIMEEYLKRHNNTLKDIPIEEYIIKLFKERNNMADFLDRAYKFIEDNHKDIITKCG